MCTSARVYISVKVCECVWEYTNGYKLGCKLVRVCVCVFVDGGEEHSIREDFPRGPQMWLILSISSTQILHTLLPGVTWVPFFHSPPFLITLLQLYKRKGFPSPIPRPTMVYSPGCKILQGTKQKGKLKILFWGGSPY